MGLKCEMRKRYKMLSCFQPEEAPSRGLLRDCENFGSFTALFSSPFLFCLKYSAIMSNNTQCLTEGFFGFHFWNSEKSSLYTQTANYETVSKIGDFANCFHHLTFNVVNGTILQLSFSSKFWLIFIFTRETREGELMSFEIDDIRDGRDK